MLPKAEKAVDGCGGGGFVAVALLLGKLNPLKASASPPNASGLAAGADVMPPNEG